MVKILENGKISHVSPEEATKILNEWLKDHPERGNDWTEVTLKAKNNDKIKFTFKDKK